MAARPVVVLMAAPAPTSAGPGSVSLASSTALADRCRVVIERHVKPLPSANPQMLEMFRSEERNSPHWSYIQDKDHAWMPEFAGKWLTHAVQLWMLAFCERRVRPCLLQGRCQTMRHWQWCLRSWNAAYWITTTSHWHVATRSLCRWQ